VSELLDLVHNMNRLAALQRTNLLDRPPEEAFDRFTRLAARICRVPIALMTLVDRDRQFFMSSFGLSEPWQTLRETPLTHSFCKHAVARRAPLLIADTTKDPVFRDNPASRELAVVAYAGIPLEVGGQPLGAFCVVDHEPRVWASEEVQMLKDLAQCVMHEIDLRTRLREVEDTLRVTREQQLEPQRFQTEPLFTRENV
jgi:GAF domain-containing protein